MSDRSRMKGRMAIYAMAGVYLLYQAYMLFKSLSRSEGTDKVIMFIAMIAFVIIGGTMVVLGVYKSSKMMKEDREAMQKINAAQKKETASAPAEEAEKIESSDDSDESEEKGSDETVKQEE